MRSSGAPRKVYRTVFWSCASSRALAWGRPSHAPSTASLSLLSMPTKKLGTRAASIFSAWRGLDPELSQGAQHKCVREGGRMDSYAGGALSCVCARTSSYRHDGARHRDGEGPRRPHHSAARGFPMGKSPGNEIWVPKKPAPFFSVFALCSTIT